MSFESIAKKARSDAFEAATRIYCGVDEHDASALELAEEELDSLIDALIEMKDEIADIREELENEEEEDE